MYCGTKREGQNKPIIMYKNNPLFPISKYIDPEDMCIIAAIVQFKKQFIDVFHIL